MKNKTIASLSLRKLLLSVLVTAPLATLPVPLWALPADQTALNTQINSTSAGVTVTSTSATAVTVDATQTNSIIRWVNFGAPGMTIVSGDTVTYNMPSSTSSILNTVTGSSATTINGTLTTGNNGGSIWVQNPNGITVGPTGVINATNVGLSTVPESEFYFSANGKLQFQENTTNGSGTIVTTNGVTLSPGATLTAASGSGNVWIAGKGITAAGTIDGNATLTGFQGGTIALASGGDLTIGDVNLKTSTLTVNQTSAGAITIDAANNLTVLGPWASLTSGNGTISTLNTASAGVFTIGAGSPGNAVLTTSSGTGDTTLTAVQAAGTGTLNVTSTGANITVRSPGKLAISATGTSLTTSSAGDLTINAGNVSGALNAYSNSGNVLAGGAMVVGGAANYGTVTSGKNVTIHLASAPASIGFLGLTNGALSITQDSGTLTLPGLTNTSISATAGNITTGGSLTATTGSIALTATAGNVTFAHAADAFTAGLGNITVWASNSVLASAAATLDASGTIALTGNGGDVNTTNLTIGGTTAPATLSVNAAKAVTLGGPITAKAVTVTAGTTLTQSATVDSTASTPGNVSYTAGKDITISAALGGTNGPNMVTLTSTGGNITLNSGVNTAATGTVNITASNDVTNNSIINAGNGNVTIAATGGNLISGTVSAARNDTLSAGKALTVSAAQSAATSFSATAGSGDLQLNAPILSAPANVTLASTSGNVSIGTGAAFSATNVTVTSGGIVDVKGGVTATSASITASGNVNIIAGITSPTLSIKGAYINGGGGITSTGTTTLDGTAISITGTNALNKLVVKNASGDASIAESDGFTLANGTNVSGNLTLSAGGPIALGSASADSITVSKALSVTTTAGAITEGTDNLTVTGNLVLASAGAITLDGSNHNGIGLNNSFGEIDIGAAPGGDVRIFEAQTMKLGTVNVGANNLTAYSGVGIIQSTGGVITIGAGKTFNVGAGTASNPGTIVLDGANKISGTVNIWTNNALHGISGGGSYLASSIKIVNDAAAATLFQLTSNVDTPNPAVNVDLQTLNANPLNVGTLNTTGTVNLTSATGAITATDLNNQFSAVNVKSGGAVTISSGAAFTVNGNITGGTGAGSYTATAGDLTIGSFTSLSSGGTTFAATGTNGKVTDSVTNIGIFGPVAFNGTNVSVTKSGHSFGPVSISATGNAAVSEATTLNLATVTVGGDLAVTSNGSIIQSGALTASGNVTAWAGQGSVTLDNASNAITGWTSLTASGNSVIKNTKDTVLGDVTVASGTLTVDASASSKKISQATGKSIYTYGATTFASAGAGTITLTNSNNQFGGLTLTTGSGDISVKEQTTLNLKKVSTTGNLTATSVGGNIIDTQANNGDISVTGTATLTAGSVSISAKNAAISTVVGNATSGDFTLATNGGLTATVNSAGNATLNPTGALVLNKSTVGGNLTIHGGTTTIDQLGALNVAGNAILWASGAITLNDPTNQFGPVQLHTAAGTIASITEAGTFNLLAQSVAAGQVVITTGGNFITSGVGGSSFTGGTGADAAHAGLIIHAPNGTITFGAGSVVVTNGLTVDASGTKDLSLLTKSGSLNGRDPFNQGTGTLIPPAP